MINGKCCVVNNEWWLSGKNDETRLSSYQDCFNLIAFKLIKSLDNLSLLFFPLKSIFAAPFFNLYAFPSAAFYQLIFIPPLINTSQQKQHGRSEPLLPHDWKQKKYIPPSCNLKGVRHRRSPRAPFVSRLSQIPGIFFQPVLIFSPLSVAAVTFPFLDFILSFCFLLFLPGRHGA